MNKKELSKAMAGKLDWTEKESLQAVEALLELVETTLAGGDKVALSGFGTFELRERAEREGRNPKTGDPLHVAARRVPVFRAAKRLKETTNF